MNRTKIEWCDYTINPVKGLCPVDCKDLQGNSYCYARAMYKRFKWNPEIRFDWAVANSVPQQKPSRIFVGSTMELFGPWVEPGWMLLILEMTKRHPEHTFLFLTKRPWELSKYNPWPDNCWVGMSAPRMREIGDMSVMGEVDAKVRFVSFEPMLEYTAPDLTAINWIIIGGRTGARKSYPENWWVRALERRAGQLHIPVFEKPNLRPVGPYRQEFPNGHSH